MDTIPGKSNWDAGFCQRSGLCVKLRDTIVEARGDVAAAAAPCGRLRPMVLVRYRS
jgi:hypothetical protein